MATRLFHAIIVCGAALGTLPLACGEGPEVTRSNEPGTEGDGGVEVRDASAEQRCLSPDGGCSEHCTALADGGCLDPCFVHTETCSPDCLQLDGSCGWPPTK